MVIPGETGLSYTHSNLQGHIFVSVSFKPYEYPSISPESRFFSLGEPANLDFNINWGSESQITEVTIQMYNEPEDQYYEMPLVEGTDYVVSGNTLTIMADFLLSLAPEPYTWQSFNVRFGLGGFSWFGVIVVPSFKPAIHPTDLVYDLSNPTDLMGTIVYNMATEVTAVSVGGVPLVEGTDYHITGSWFFLHDTFLSMALPQVDDEVIVCFTFDTSDDACVKVKAIQSGVINAVIAPSFISFYEHEFPEYADIEITWNSATQVTGLDVAVASQWGVDVFPWDAYQVTDHGTGTATLRIFFPSDRSAGTSDQIGRNAEKAESYTWVTVDIKFDVGAPAKFRMLIIEQRFNVNVTIQPEGAGWISGNWDYRPGEMVELFAGANWNYMFLHWEDTEGNVVSTANPFTFTMPLQDVNLVARFERMYHVNFYVMWGFGELSATINGEPFSGGLPVAGSSRLEFTATPQPGWMVQEWQVNGVVVEGNQTNTLVIDGFNTDITVTVGFKTIPYQSPSIYPEYQIFSLGEPADVIFNINWGSETEITQVATWIYDENEQESYRHVLIPGVDYLVEGNLLTIKADFILWLNIEPYDWRSFEVNFGLGGFGWFGIAAVPTFKPVLIPDELEYDLSNPGDLLVTIVYNLATEVTAVSVAGVPLAEGTDYQVNGSWFFLKDAYLSTALTQPDDEVTVCLAFDTGYNVCVEVKAIQSGVVNAAISPDFISFYEHEFPEYTDIEITWNSATEVTGLEVLVASQWGVEQFPWEFYQVTDHGNGTATLRVFFMPGKNLSQIPGFGQKAEKAETFTWVTVGIKFDVGAPANFRMLIIDQRFNVNVTIEPEGAGWISGDWDYRPGEMVELLAGEHWNYKFLQWEDTQGNLVSTENPYIFTMPQHDVNLVARFYRLYSVEFWVSGFGNGSISASVDGQPLSYGQMVKEGSTVVFNATPNPGYTVKEWRVNGQTVPQHQTTTLELTLTSNVMVTVEFQAIPPDSYQVFYSVVDGQGGTLSAMANGAQVANGQYVSQGSNVTFSATPNAGKQVKEWKINGTVYQVNGEPYKENTLVISGLNQDINVTVEFETITYTVTFIVEDEAGNPIGDATITFDGVAYAPGVYVFAGLEPGIYAYSVAKEGYLESPGNVEVVNADLTVNVVLELKTYTVSFVVEKGDGTPIADAIITLGNQTNAAGDYVFTGLVPGSYAYKVEKAGYFDATGSVDVVNQDVNLTVTLNVDDTGISDLQLTQLLVYPVPARTILHIKSPEMMREVRILDMLGQQVYSARHAGLKHEVNVSGLKDGIYFVQVITARKIETRRIQVQK